MKKTIIRTTLAVAVLFGLTARANAGDEALAALGGFIAGVVTGAVIDHHDDVHAGVRVSVGSYHGAGCHSHGRVSCGVCYPPRPRGYYETRYVRVWVPGYWDIVVNDCGLRSRVWISGRYEHRPRKVWVAHRDSVRRDHRRDFDRNRRDGHRDRHHTDGRRDGRHDRRDGDNGRPRRG